MAGIIAVYSLVIAVLLAGDIRPPQDKTYSLYGYVRTRISVNSVIVLILYPSGFLHLAAGLSVGLTGLAAGYAIGVVGDMVRKITYWKKAS